MEFEEGMRSRKQQAVVLKPIETKVKNRGDDMKISLEEPVSPAGRLFNEPNFNVHILAIMGSKIKINLDLAKQNLVHTLLKHPRFSSLQVVDEESGSGKMKWVRTEVDLDKHIIVPIIDPNMEEFISPDKFLENYIYSLTKNNLLLDRSKPLWDVHVLNLKTSNAEGVVIFRIHHSLGDGISLMSLLLACTRQIEKPEAVPTLPTKKIINTYDHNNRFISKLSIYYCFLGLWWILKLFWNTFVDFVLFVATALFLKDTHTPLRGLPGCEHNPRRIIFRVVSFDDIKLVKNAMASTVNDVAVGITQAGLSRYLNRRYGENGEAFPKKIRLRSNLLVNIRPSPGIQSLADMMEKNSEAKWGNWIGYVLLPFDICLRDNPLDYIRTAKAIIDRKKHSLEALCTFSISGFIFALFGIKRTSALFHKILSATTMAFSNVVGPLEEIGFYGHPMAYLAGATYGQPHELMVNFQSYVNKMTIVLSVDEATIPDPHRLCDDIVESLKLMKDALLQKGLLK
ncbi:wax ester synthase/diacylglycerol acyltransferase 11 [Cannabis sativa]|uniref:Diacylglycerol O-acyltransferase n=1 Tax=Cannabis sativa TaxID=3483 RepID=A0A7J6I0W8_CANSA|nr:wax ester synthase/diacylglycerol acyltransferase 11 [Cannabis sativa]KAF4384564.1 hypothetical protein F8388_003871 [Cannabis sativa]KAF4401016.1 hypothetical protein G4B88_013857 [Cannabis sativa]